MHSIESFKGVQNAFVQMYFLLDKTRELYIYIFFIQFKVRDFHTRTTYPRNTVHAAIQIWN